MVRTSATRRRTKASRDGLSFVLWVFVLSRVFFLGVGALAHSMLPQARPGGSPLQPPGFLNYWAHWDGAWYSEIATRGYGAHAPASTAFFPLYPMLVRLGSYLGGGPALWGVLISLLSTFFALYFLYGIAEKLYDARVARAATLCLAFFPTAFFLNAVYTEGLFLALTTGSIWAVYVRRDLLLAGVLGAFAAATRNLGVLLVVPLFFEWVRNRREFGRRGLAEIGLVFAGLAAYAIFLGGRFGDPLIFAHQQSAYWGRALTSPFTTADMAWRTAKGGIVYILHPATLFSNTSAEPALSASNTLNLAFLVIFLLVMGVGLVVLPPGLTIYALVITLLPVLTPSPQFPLMSLPRFVLGAFPFFLALGYPLARSDRGLALWLILSGALGVALTALFVTWRWVA